MELEREVRKNKELQDRIEVLSKNFETVNIALINLMNTSEVQQMLRREEQERIEERM